MSSPVNPNPAAAAGEVRIDAEPRPLPRHIAIEGPIGVGKTTLARRLALQLQYPLLLEPAAENPFLDRFYLQGRRHALPTQLFFLLVSPEQHPSLHLRWLAHLAVLLKNPLFRQNLLAAETADDVLAVLDAEEEARSADSQSDQR